MSLTTSEYDSLLREYEQRQLDGEMDLRRRREEVTRDVPAIAEIEEQIVHGSVQAARLALAGNSSALDALSRTNDWLIKQKHQLLTGAGYPADYLDRRYVCPICKDTGTETVTQPDGSIVRRPCSCFRRAIIDQNVRIGDGCRIGIDDIPRQEGDFEMYSYHDGIIVINKNAVIKNRSAEGYIWKMRSTALVWVISNEHVPGFDLFQRVFLADIFHNPQHGAEVHRDMFRLADCGAVRVKYGA